MADKISNQSSPIYDYLYWRGDISFEALPLCEVDNLVFSTISYVDFDEVIAEDIGEKKPPVLLSVTKNYLTRKHGTLKNLGVMLPKEIITLLVRAAKTQRFGLTRPFCYVNRICDREEKQFSAVSFMLPGGGTFVSFRGTDDTLVGWKENLNMSFMHPVPAQTEALNYLEDIASKTSGPLYLGGHSKGGNLAIYASVEASYATRERIRAVYNNDGPGFTADFICSDAYRAMSAKIHTFVPQSSIIGMLLEQEENYQVVKSRSTGLLQHNVLSWEVMGGSIVKLDSVDDGSKRIDKSLKAWLGGLDAKKREDFVDSLFEALSSTNAKTLTDLNADKTKLIRAWNSLDAETRSNLMKCINMVIGKKAVKQSKATENGEE